MPQVERASSAAQWVSSVLSADVLRMERARWSAEQEDDEAVHDVRVACRRMRSHLKAFEAGVDKAWRLRMIEELRWLGDVCGPARDLEVLRLRIEESDAWPDDTSRRLLVAVSQSEERRRTEALEQVAGTRVDRLLVTTLAGIEAGSASSAAAEGYAAGLVDAAYERFLVGVQRLKPDSSDKRWHKGRIRAKQARYVAEAAETVLGPDTQHQAKTAKRMQTELGEINDRVVSAQLLADIAAEAADAALRDAADRAAKEQVEQGRALRSQVLELRDELLG